MNFLGQRKFLLLFLLCCLLFNPLFLNGQDLCERPFPEINKDTILERFVTSIEAGETPHQALDKVADFVFQKAKIGTKFLRENRQLCYEVGGINVSMEYEINGTKKPTIIRVKGEILREYYVYLLVSSFYSRSTVKEGKETQEIYDVAISLGLKNIAPDEIVISADKNKLCPGETATIKAELKCGDCLLERNNISFQLKGPGEVSPVDTTTGIDGIAETTFKATEEGTSIITAYYHNYILGVKQADISLKTEQCIYNWDIEIITDFKNKPEVEGRVYTWGSITKFQNIPLYKWKPVLPSIFNFYESKGHLTYGKFNYFDGEHYIPGNAQGDIKWGLTVSPKQEELEVGEIKNLVLNFGLNEFVITRIRYVDGTSEPLHFITTDLFEIPLEKLREGKSFLILIDDEWQEAKGSAHFRFTPSKTQSRQIREKL